MTGYWIAVASAEHVRLGLAGGFMQVCHGKAGPLRRIRAGDGIAYYSPTETFGGGERLQAFTAIGRVCGGEPYRADMGAGFRPSRRDVAWLAASEASIKPLLDRLELTSGRLNWGHLFRFGLVAVSAHDFTLISQAMSACAPDAVKAA
ncbi:EVE domain-containing protein [Bosea sp. BIWAKO-01]|uniref:EVE domain-containing protein n=1 Tax=Bosea sp. BIWAKO-01 TaxID=506668 RepID=UPI0008529761|nr:EVE domain-containing protein [Bosea sp. BIWAKO-01]GAU84936.1 hypothetical protein BIWAKO_04878 [Bosea sp. BIWAKO-01]